MPRYREDYSLTQRTLPSGKKVWYYQTYDENGRRTTMRSTGEVKKKEARKYCNRLLREDRLVPKAPYRFKDFAADFWDWEKCSYVALTKPSEEHAKNQRYILLRDVMPYFGEKPIDEIKRSDIEAWLMKLQEREASPRRNKNRKAPPK